MRKFLIGLTLALIVSVCIEMLNTYFLKTKVPDFIAGWLSCIAYFFGYYSYEIKNIE